MKYANLVRPFIAVAICFEEPTRTGTKCPTGQVLVHNMEQALSLNENDKDTTG